MLYMLQNYSCFIMTCAPVPQTVPYWPYWSNSRIQATLTRFHYVSPWLLRDYEKNKQGEPISRWTNHVQRWMSLWNVVHVFFHIGLLPFSTPCYLKQRNAQELNGIKSHWPCMLACGVSIWLNTHAWSELKCSEMPQSISNNLKPSQTISSQLWLVLGSKFTLWSLLSTNKRYRMLWHHMIRLIQYDTVMFEQYVIHFIIFYFNIFLLTANVFHCLLMYVIWDCIMSYCALTCSIMLLHVLTWSYMFLPHPTAMRHLKTYHNPTLPKQQAAAIKTIPATDKCIELPHITPHLDE